jgi:hypothetical protein
VPPRDKDVGRLSLRRLSTLALLAAVALTSLLDASAAMAATAMEPDLRTLPPRSLRLDRADVSPDGAGTMHNVLRFSNTVWNAGPGKLVVRAVINPTTKEGPAYQRVFNGDGTFTDYAVGKLYWHAAHQHYHFDNWGRYQLWKKADYDAWKASGGSNGAPDQIGTKTTSCIMDEEFITTLPGTPYPAVFPSSGCYPDASNVIQQGISVGWGDTYDYWRSEQWIDLNQSTLADGQYVLRSVTDPNNLITESPGKADASRESTTANEGITNFSVSAGKLIDGARPTGTVSINDVDAQTTSSRVTVKVLGRDDIAGVDQVRLSNDGSAWQTFGYTGVDSTAQSIGWDLANPTYGGNATAGTKRVYAQFHDKAGNWSTSETDTIELVGPSSSAYAQAVLTDSPVGYWRLGDTSGTTALDQRGAANGTYVNAPTLGSAGLLPGESDKAVGLDGTNDHVRVPASSSLDLTNAITVEAWIKPAALPAAGSFASIVTKPEAYTLQFNGPRLELTVIQGGDRKRLQAPSGAVVAGQAYHVVGTFDGTTQRLYLNGVQVASAALAGSASTSSAALYMGSWSGGDEFLRGTLDEVAVYRGVLSAARVKAHYDAAAGSTQPPASVAAPSGLTASAASPSAIDLRWTDNSTNETGFVLERSADSTFAAPVARTLAAGTTSFSDSGLSASTTYWYRVKAIASSTSSAYSNAVSARTLDPPPAQSYSQLVLADGPISYWRLGETAGTVASDQKVANNGTFVGAPALGQLSLLATDAQNRALRTDGVDDRVRVPNSSSLALSSAITLETWIKPTTVPSVGFASVVTKPEAYSIQFNAGRLEFTVIQNGVRRRLQAPSGAVIAGATYHVVGTHDGATQRLYLNGVQVASQALSGPATIFGSDLFMASWDGASEFFAGVIDDVAVYGKVLTAAQVKGHFDAGKGP